jgi:hypothetical protein
MMEMPDAAQEAAKPSGGDPSRDRSRVRGADITPGPLPVSARRDGSYDPI